MMLKDTQIEKPLTNMSTMGGQAFSNDQIMSALRKSTIVDNLQESEIRVLADLISGKYLEAKTYVAELEEDPFKDTLMILVEGEIVISATVNNEPVSLRLEAPGDLARVVSFVGGGNMKISARINVKKDSAVLLLQRSRLESLLHAHPSIPYCVMRNLVLHVHGVARRNSGAKEQMSEYLYRTQAIL